MLIVLAVATSFWHATAHASPDDAPDALKRLLMERGLLSPDTPAAVTTSAPGDASALVQIVRDRASDMVITAMNFLGVPYRLGGSSSEAGFDCSGFTRHIFEMSLGLVLPRRADEQAHAAGLLTVERDELRPGDLVFFNTLRRTFSHVGIYIGEGKFIHAPKPGGAVRVEDMRYAYWRQRYDGARRAGPKPEVETQVVPTAEARANADASTTHTAATAR